MSPETAQQIAFIVLSLVALGGAAGVVVARSVFASALFLVVSMFGVAGLYVTLSASFLAVVQILIYVGAISVLFIFAVMLTPQVMEEEALVNSQWSMGGLVALTIFGILAVLAYRADWPLVPGNVAPSASAIVVTDAEAEDGMPIEQARELPGAVVEERADGETVVRVPGNIDRIGRGFVTEFLLPFEVISVILLVALVGAIAIARE